MQDNLVQVNESQASFVGTLETGKDTAEICSEVRLAIEEKTKFRKRMEQQQQFDSSESSSQSQTDKLPEEVGLTNTDQMDGISTLTISEQENSGERIGSYDTKERKDVSLAIITPPVSQLRNKLLVLDLNGLLADIVYQPPKTFKADAYIGGRASENLVLNFFF